MTGVLGMTQLLLESQPTEEQKDYIAAIKQSSDLLLGVIDGMYLSVCVYECVCVCMYLSVCVIHWEYKNNFRRVIFWRRFVSLSLILSYSLFRHPSIHPIHPPIHPSIHPHRYSGFQ